MKRQFTRLQVLREDADCLLVRALPQDAAQRNLRTVLLLQARVAAGAPELLQRMQHELSLAPLLPERYVARARELCTVDDKPALVLQDPGVATLEAMLQGALPLQQFLRLALGITKALAALHQQDVIHKQLHPGNILIDRKAKSSKALHHHSRVLAVEHSGECCRSISQRCQDHGAVGNAFRTRRTNRAPDRRLYWLNFDERHKVTEATWGQLPGNLQRSLCDNNKARPICDRTAGL